MDIFTNALYPTIAADATMLNLIQYTDGKGATKIACFEDKAPSDIRDQTKIIASVDESPTYSAQGQCTNAKSIVTLVVTGGTLSSVKSATRRLRAILGGHRAALMGTVWVDMCVVENISAQTPIPQFAEEFGKFTRMMVLRLSHEIDAAAT